MDQLSRDAVAAANAGVSYGKFMAMKTPVAIAPKPLPPMRACAYCGKAFPLRDRFNRLYCGDECQIATQNRRRYERMKQKREAKGG